MMLHAEVAIQLFKMILWLITMLLWLLLMLTSSYCFRTIRTRLLEAGYRMRRFTSVPYVIRAQRSYIQAAPSKGWSTLPVYVFWITLLTGLVLWFALWLSPTGIRVLIAFRDVIDHWR
jgi:hypothetical protein